MIRKIPFSSLLVAGVLAALALVGCASNPIAEAETPMQTAYAIERSYNIVLENAIDLVEANPQLRDRLLTIEARTTPIIDTLSQAITDYVEARAQFALGETTEERIAAVGANLDGWILQAQRALVDLAAALE